jgi:hypothetical protein
MRSRTIVTGLAVLVLGYVAVIALAPLAEDAKLSIAVPYVMRWDVPVATGGVITVHRFDDDTFFDGIQRLEATYQALPPDGRLEPIGTWRGSVYQPRARTIGKCVIFTPERSALFIRSEYGRWQAFPMNTLEQWDERLIARTDRDRIRAATHVNDPSGRAYYLVRAVLPDEYLFIIDGTTKYPDPAARFVLRLSKSCERFTLERMQP